MIPTAHIGATSKDQIAKTVLMPGDPLRAKFIAEHFLEDITQYNAVRGMLGYTGTYKGKRISVQGSGMGMPSIGIYSYELYNFYDVDNIIRVGTAGGISTALKIRDVVIANGACTNSNFDIQYNLPGNYAPTSTYELVETAAATARELSISYKVGNVLSSDIFYNADMTAIAKWRELGVLAVEMEAAALFMNAAKSKKNALAILTISDIIGGEETSAADREKGFKDMMQLSLETAIKL